MRNSAGVTLVELLIVVSIIGILVLAMGFSFQDWNAAYKAESQIKEMYSDFMDARIGAMDRNRYFFISLSATQYALYEDANDNGNPDAAEMLPSFPKNLSYYMTWNGGGSQITFSKRGLLVPPSRSMWIAPAETDYNCIVLSRTRINLGKWDGTSCDAK